MADSDETPQQAVESIKSALLAAEQANPDSHALRVLHRALERGFRNHGHLLGFTPDEVITMAGGGTPKLGGGA